MPAPVPQLTPALPLVSLGVADNDPRANAAPCFPEGNIDRLIASVAAYLREEDVQRVRDAYELSASAHAGQFRASGEPYVSHPVAVAEILAGWQLDSQALCAALLHDVMEDTEISKAEIAERFGKVVAELVDGVSKLDKIEFQSKEDAQAENFRKMLMAMARDVRVILVKLADRTHNMRTLGCVRQDKQRRIARETLEIHAPIANRLGLHAVYRELQDLAFQAMYPLRYRVLERAMKAARGNRREVVGKITEAIRTRLPERGLDADVFGREKSLYSIFRKMRDKHLTFSQVLDIYGFRVVVKDVAACYLALGALHALYKPVPGKFKDYIAIPKANGYQSLHTTLIGPFGTPVEVQIRTAEMQQIAQTGVASHWLYKDSEQSLDDLQANTHRWLQSLLELQSSAPDSAEFLEHVKIDLFPGEVYVFTPKGKIMSLPRGATAVDFAYAVHTDVGHCCVACRINHELMPLRSELNSGDQVDIITATHPNPNPAWLGYVKTGKARAQIRHFLKNMQVEESAQLGERLLTQALRQFGVTADEIGEASWTQWLESADLRSRKEALADVGQGKVSATFVARSLLKLQTEQESAGSIETPEGALLIRGSEGMAVQIARCCQPIPGDPIVGHMRKGSGLMIHAHDCPTLRRNRKDGDQWMDVEWERDTSRVFEVGIRVVSVNRPGVLAKVAFEIAECGANIQDVGMEEDGSLYTQIHFTLQVTDRLHLARIMKGLRRVPEVVRINRLRAADKAEEARGKTH
ncbi:MAG: bifunctional (p)ppGpp synthetase/guanosine-3',5'-bis(diphosphate) 3'-pyrophosphohydrolase [Methyloversatilis sp.]|nr:bifunctional (p)ppGpp synthetase/guanosine-3',5'-bis(diphosphate) 3'-pyrophosphohydrolase [Methyloversatilis sp.]MBP6193540.1 bifunctional (p)ppGpp synthetase/guanosine-3',5'-bis(diphosphate) 3'-pyrophosphohydrolase [Methyloversatilis sp.]MBP9116775.1 bifunctional (p)ppGpp synthetase/guanosine-3',5'-bis(diphosphate) 3'-pyrophosphohydrolase [Methyloversatilis sp.]